MKKLNLIYCFIFLATLLSCSSDDSTPEASIPDTPVKAFIAKEAYNIGTINVKSKTLFDDAGYMFYVYDADVNCAGYNNVLYKRTARVIPANVAKFEFFIKTDKLKKGKFEGKGPFVKITDGTKNFVGCDIEITEVTETTVKAKVSGGSKDDGTYIEGAFTANICSTQVLSRIR